MQPDPFFNYATANYLTQRKEERKHEAIIQSEKKINYLFGLINLIVIFCIFWLLWYVFMNPNTVMRLYTPMYGFSLVVGFITMLVLIHQVADDYPFAQAKSGGQGLFPRGILLTIVTFLRTGKN